MSPEDAAALLEMANEWEVDHYGSNLSAAVWRAAAVQLRSKVVTLGEPPTIDRV